jgi:hypothetical protein
MRGKTKGQILIIVLTSREIILFSRDIFQTVIISSLIWHYNSWSSYTITLSNEATRGSLAEKNGYQEELNKKKNVCERKVELEWESEGF